MRERLREVAEQPLRLGVVLLGEQADVVREADEPVEERVRLVVPAEQLVAVDEPERAREKDALAGRAARRRRRRACGSGGRSPSRSSSRSTASTVPRIARVVGGQEADERNQQEARVELLRAVGLDERAERRVEAALADLRMDLRRGARASGRPARRGPAPRPCAPRGRTRPTPSPSSARSAVARRGSPRCPRRARARPSRGSSSSACWSCHAVRLLREPVHARLVERVHHLAVDVELELLARGVADPHRR